jgi:hypothetical protein
MAAETRSTWKDDLKKPVNLIGILLGVFGLVGTIYGVIAYYDAHKVQEISFIRNVVRIIDNSTAAQAIKIVDSNNNLIKDNVYVGVFAMWNPGNANIGPDRIRRNIKYTIRGEGKVLDSTIVKQNKDGIWEFALTPDPLSRSLSLSWKYFDKGMGYTAKIIYTGNDKTDIIVDGGYIEDLRPLQNAGDALETAKFFVRAQLLLMLVMLIPMGLVLPRQIRRISPDRWWKMGDWWDKVRGSPFDAMYTIMLLLMPTLTMISIIVVINSREIVPLPAIARELSPPH